MDRVEFVAPDAAIEHLNPSLVCIEFPAGPGVDQRNREREVVRAKHQLGLLVGIRLDRMLGVIHGGEALTYVDVGDLVARGDDVIGGLAEHLQNIARAALDRGRKRRGCLLRCRIGLLRLRRGAQQRQRQAARQGRTLKRLQTDHGETSAGIRAPPASQSL